MAENSQFAQRIYETSFWSKTSELLNKEWKDRKSDLAPWKARLDNPAARQIRAFLYDVLSQDIFLYADKNLSNTLNLWNIIEPDIKRLTSRKVPSEDKAQIVANWVDQWVPPLQVPTLMLAGRFTDPDLALARIDEIEGAIRLGISFIPDIRGFFKNLRRIEDTRGNRLEWRVTAEMIPWDQIPENDVLDRETIQDLQSACQEKSLVFSLGTLDEYFCVVISGDKDWTSRFGSDSHLIDLPDLKNLTSEFIDQPIAPAGPAGQLDHTPQTASPQSPLITSTYHISDETVEGLQKLLLDGFFQRLARITLLPAIDEQPADSDIAVWLTDILDNASWLDDQIGQHVVRYRGATRLAWISAPAWESAQIDRTPMHLMESNHALEGIRRAGPDPLVILNMRLAPHPEYFNSARQIVSKIKESFEELILISYSQKDLGPLKLAYEQMQALWPIVVSVTQQWQTRILPNLNGEHLVVVHAGHLQSRNWLPMLPSKELLPLPEAALISGIDNPQEFQPATISVVNAIGQLLGSYGIYPPIAPKMSRSDGWNLGTLPLPWEPAQVGSLEGLLAASTHWNFVGYSKDQWQTFAREDLKPSTDAAKLLGFEQANGPLASAALIDLGGIARLGNRWLAFLLENAPTDAEGKLRIPSTNSGRKLTLTAAEIQEFLQCFEDLGRLTSFSKSSPVGHSLSRARYGWKADRSSPSDLR